jgi:hypothetical protein
LNNMNVNGKDDIPYMQWEIKIVWNHQPEYYVVIYIYIVLMLNIPEICWTSQFLLLLKTFSQSTGWDVCDQNHFAQLYKSKMTNSSKVTLEQRL